MEDVFMLVGLSIAMFVGSYVAGSLPLVVPFSESRLRLITVLGAGLLVGTALAVIIPEGVQSIYSAAENFDHASRPAPSGVAKVQPDGQGGIAPGKISPTVQLPTDIVSLQSQKKESANNRNDQVAGVQQVLLDRGKRAQHAPAQVADFEKRLRHKRDGVEHKHGGDQGALEHAGDVDFPDQHEDSHQGSVSHGHSHKADAHGAVGMALVAGFVLMLLVDQLAQHRSGRDVDLATGGSVQPRYKITATIGLVVHAAADGVALGAASSSAHSEIQWIVFLAIMLHKAPASFGLVTFLLHEGLDKLRIRRHLLIFALAAPIAAVLTYLFISHGGNNEKLTSMNTTGVLLLFSAGTFLYVATVHVLPEVAASGHGHSSGGGHSASGFRLNELVALVFGAVAPTFLTLGHSH